MQPVLGGFSCSSDLALLYEFMQYNRTANMSVKHPFIHSFLVISLPFFKSMYQYMLSMNFTIPFILSGYSYICPALTDGTIRYLM